MYFVILRSKQSEMLALRDLVDEIVENGEIVPIIEPMANDRTLDIALDRFVDATLEFCMIGNPERGELQNLPLATIKEQVFDAHLEEYDNVIATLYVGGATTTEGIEEFINLYEPRARAYFFTGQTSAAVVDAIVADEPQYVMFLRSAGIARAVQDRFAAEIVVDVVESFVGRLKNSDFPDDEFFSDQHLTTPNEHAEHFGDYSIIPRGLATGWAPYCVVIHYVYKRHDEGDALWIKHYKSDTNDSPDDPAGKYREALDKLIADLPTLGDDNRTRVTAQFEGDDTRDHYPALATLKRRGIVHHLELILGMI
jgi:hypothetical protein